MVFSQMCPGLAWIRGIDPDDLVKLGEKKGSKREHYEKDYVSKESHGHPGPAGLLSKERTVNSSAQREVRSWGTYLRDSGPQHA